MNSAMDHSPRNHGSLSCVLQVRILAASGLPEVWKLSMGTSENMIAYIILTKKHVNVNGFHGYVDYGSRLGVLGLPRISPTPELTMSTVMNASIQAFTAFGRY